MMIRNASLAAGGLLLLGMLTSQAQAAPPSTKDAAMSTQTVDVEKAHYGRRCWRRHGKLYCRHYGRRHYPYAYYNNWGYPGPAFGFYFGGGNRWGHHHHGHRRW